MNPISKIYHTNDCSICYETYEKDKVNNCLLLKCGHVFHKTCVASYIQHQSVCPMCMNKAFIPILMKDILKEAGKKGLEGSKKAGVYVFVGSMAMAMFFNLRNAINYSLYSEEQLDPYRGENRYAFDPRRSEDALKWGLTALTLIGTSCAFYVIKELHKRRNQSLESELAEEINYTPPAIE